MQPENGSPLFTVTYSILAHIILKIVFAVFIRPNGICARAGLALGAAYIREGIECRSGFPVWGNNEWPN